MTSPYPVWLLTWLYSPNKEREAVGERRERKRRRRKGEREERRGEKREGGKE